jgi:hypothetical protein
VLKVEEMREDCRRLPPIASKIDIYEDSTSTHQIDFHIMVTSTGSFTRTINDSIEFDEIHGHFQDISPPGSTTRQLHSPKTTTKYVQSGYINYKNDIYALTCGHELRKSILKIPDQNQWRSVSIK